MVERPILSSASRGAALCCSDVAPGAYDSELSLVQRRVFPEWAHRKTQRRGKPSPAQEGQYQKIFGEFSASEIEVVVASFHLQSGGKIPEPVCRRVDTWLRQAMKTSPRAVLPISFPTAQEEAKRAALRK